MPYLTIRMNDKDLGWYELEGPPTVIGRQREAQICLVDSRLSRNHCRFERDGDDWAIVDLGSRNGTWCDGVSVDRVILLDRDTIHVGRTVLTFHEGIPPETGKFRPRMSLRPVDPHEALAGTVVGLTVVSRTEQERPADPWQAMSSRIRPRPIPRPEQPAEMATAATALLEETPESGGGDVVLDEMPAPKIRPKRHRALPKPILVELPTSPIAAAEEVGELAERTRPRPKSPAAAAAVPVAGPAAANPLATVVQMLPQQRTITRWKPAVDFWIFVSMTAVLLAGMVLVATMLGGL